MFGEEILSRLHRTPRQQRRLQRHLHPADDVRLYRRTLAVLAYDRGRPVTDIADLLGVTRQRVPN